MTQSGYVFEKGGAIDVGSHGDHDFVYHSGDPVPDSGESDFVFEAGVGFGVIVIDDFERGDLSPYTGYYSGDGGPAEIGIQTSRVYEGTYAIWDTSGGGGSSSRSYLWSKTGLNYYPQPGDTFEWYVNLTSNSDSSIWFALAKEDNINESVQGGYNIKHHNDLLSFRVKTADDSAADELFRQSYNPPDDGSTYIRGVCEWQDDFTFNVRMEDLNGNTLASGSGQDTNQQFTREGWGWETQTDKHAFDFARKIA